MSDMSTERASVSARDLSRHAASVLDRVEHGERLIVTRDGEPVAEIIPIDPAQRMLARWVKDGLIAELPAPRLGEGGHGGQRHSPATDHLDVRSDHY
jgi:prevent-host-death family protein